MNHTSPGFSGSSLVDLVDRTDAHRSHDLLQASRSKTSSSVWPTARRIVLFGFRSFGSIFIWKFSGSRQLWGHARMHFEQTLIEWSSLSIWCNKTVRIAKFAAFNALQYYWISRIFCETFTWKIEPIRLQRDSWFLEKKNLAKFAAYLTASLDAFWASLGWTVSFNYMVATKLSWIEGKCKQKAIS